MHLVNVLVLLKPLSTFIVSEVAQSCPTLCDPVDCSPPGSSVHGLLQARILEWVASSLPSKEHHTSSHTSKHPEKTLPRHSTDCSGPPPTSSMPQWFARPLSNLDSEAYYCCFCFPICLWFPLI